MNKEEAIQSILNRMSDELNSLIDDDRFDAMEPEDIIKLALEMALHYESLPPVIKNPLLGVVDRDGAVFVVDDSFKISLYNNQPVEIDYDED